MFGTVGTVGKTASVPKCPTNYHLKNSNLSGFGQLGQLGQQKTNVSEIDTKTLI